MAIRWLLEKGVVASVIIGVKTIAQLEENCGGAIGWQLTPDEVLKIVLLGQCMVGFALLCIAGERVG
mgnify:CR=1 FL=1